MAPFANAAATPSLFSAVTLGGKKDPVQLKHRVAMAPLTRVRTGDAGTPTDLVAQYYSQRASDGGLLITEATNISATARGYFGAPGIFQQNQVESWKPVTKAIHDKGGKVFVQLWHTGRVGHPLNQPGGQLPVSSSATSMANVKSHAVTSEGRKDYVTPRALDIAEIPDVVADYKRAAENAIAAGFDGVEIHAANGYLLEKFLCDSVNTRTDQYGGSVENRARLIFEVLDAVLASLPSSKVGIRLSPFGDTFGCNDLWPCSGGASNNFFPSGINVAIMPNHRLEIRASLRKPQHGQIHICRQQAASCTALVRGSQISSSFAGGSVK